MIKDGKIVFISDIHMGCHEGLFPEKPWHPWGWFGVERAKFLGEFLSRLADDPQVHTVVVLGDLFDDWVVPTHLPPAEDSDAPDALLQRIVQAGENEPIRQGFIRLAGQGKELRYVHGNHDMFLAEGLLHQWVPDFVCEPDNAGPGTGAYVLDGLLRAEHGCAYCLANAPYLEDGEYRYPVGYYLARIDAYNRAVNNNSADYLHIFARLCDSLLDKDENVGEALLAEAVDAKLAPGSPFIMNNAYPNDLTVSSVATQFMDWFAQWDKRNYPVKAALAVTGEVFGLRQIMRDLWLKPGKAKIAVCGHTHRASLWAYPHSAGEPDPDRPCDSIRSFVAKASFLPKRTTKTTRYRLEICKTSFVIS